MVFILFRKRERRSKEKQLFSQPTPPLSLKKGRSQGGRGSSLQLTRSHLPPYILPPLGLVPEWERGRGCHLWESKTINYRIGIKTTVPLVENQISIRYYWHHYLIPTILVRWLINFNWLSVNNDVHWDYRSPGRKSAIDSFLDTYRSRKEWIGAHWTLRCCKRRPDCTKRLSSKKDEYRILIIDWLKGIVSWLLIDCDYCISDYRLIESQIRYADDRFMKEHNHILWSKYTVLVSYRLQDEYGRSLSYHPEQPW